MLAYLLIDRHCNDKLPRPLRRIATWLKPWSGFVCPIVYF
jgi:hypothetical protein